MFCLVEHDSEVAYIKPLSAKALIIYIPFTNNKVQCLSQRDVIK